MVKNLPAMQESRVQSLSWRDPLVKEMATHSCIPAWRIPRIEEPGELQSMGSRRLDSTERLTLTQLSSEKATCLKRRKQTLTLSLLLANLHQICDKVQVALPDGQTLPWGQL